MNKMACLIAIPALALSVGCTNMTPTEQSTLSGAVIGGAAGAVVGNIYGRNQ